MRIANDVRSRLATLSVMMMSWNLLVPSVAVARDLPGGWESVVSLKPGTYVQVFTDSTADKKGIAGKLEKADADGISLKLRKSGVRTLQKSEIRTVKIAKHQAAPLVGAGMLAAGSGIMLAGTVSDVATLNSGRITKSSNGSMQGLGIIVMIAGVVVALVFSGGKVIYQR